MIKNELRFPAMATFFVAIFAVLLTACGKAPESLPSNEPIVSGNTIRFPANSSAAQRLLTSPVVAAHESVFSLPARVVWDEDHTSRITSPIAGRIDEIMVQAGSRVKVNQPLAQLNSPELGNAQAESAHAQAELSQAERNLARAKDLFAVNGVAGKDIEQAQLDLARTRAEAERASLRLKSLGASSTVDQRFALRSPIAGVVVERNINPGMEWRPDQPGAPLFVISDPTYLWCWIDAPERAINILHSGMKVTLRASAWPEETFEAQIDHIGDALDPISRTLKVRARLRNPQRHLKSEMYVTAELTSQAHGVLDVPTKAVFISNGMQQVFIRTAEGQFTRRTIMPVAFSDQWVSIEKGLNKGDQVVVDGALYLQKLLDENSRSGSNDVSPAAPVNTPLVK
ncbi:MAG TPA: efflux RND transporter periplasmic adaptor subunit [Sulfuricella sp.]|nr:efflux RND transporter periplasmic adaptor subunit [Sulfuricella sp.]